MLPPQARQCGVHGTAISGLPPYTISAANAQLPQIHADNLSDVAIGASYRLAQDQQIIRKGRSVAYNKGFTRLAVLMRDFVPPRLSYAPQETVLKETVALPAP